MVRPEHIHTPYQISQVEYFPGEERRLLRSWTLAALDPEREQFVMMYPMLHPRKLGLGVVFGGGGSSKKGMLAELVRSTLDIPSPARMGTIAVRNSSERYREYALKARSDIEKACIPRSHLGYYVDHNIHLSAQHAALASLTEQDWIDNWWGDHPMGLGPFTNAHVEHEDSDHTMIGRWATMVASHPHIVELAEQEIAADLSNTIKRDTNVGLITLVGPRNFDLGRQYFKDAFILPVGNILFLADDADISDPTEREVVKTRNELDMRSIFPMVTVDKIPKRKLIDLHALLDDPIRRKLQLAAAAHKSAVEEYNPFYSGLTREQSADGWALPLVIAGLKAASDPEVVIIVRDEQFKGEENMLIWALRTVIHGMIFATRYPHDPTGNRLIVPEYQMED